MDVTRRVFKQGAGIEKPKKGDEVTIESTGNLQDDKVGDHRRVQNTSEQLRTGRNLRPKASDTQAISHLNWESSSQDLADVLRSLQKRTSAYIHPRPISFET